MAHMTKAGQLWDLADKCEQRAVEYLEAYFDYTPQQQRQNSPIVDEAAKFMSLATGLRAAGDNDWQQTEG